MKEKYELSNSQKQIQQMSNFESEGNVCGISASVIYKKPINVDAIKHSINRLYKNNKILMTKIENNGDTFYQTIDHTYLNYAIIEFENENAFIAFCEKESKISKKISDNLFNITVAKIGNIEHGIFINLHHIIADAVSVQIIINELERYYNDYLFNINSKNNTGKYTNYLTDEKEYLSSITFKKDIEYWQNKLSEYGCTYLYNNDYSNLSSKRFSFCIDDNLSSTIVNYCQSKSISLLTFFSLIYASYFCSIKNYKKFIFGSSIDTREDKYKNTIGMFANTLVFSIVPDFDKDWEYNLLKARKSQLKSLRHYKCNYEMVLEASQLIGKTQETPYDVYISYQTIKKSENITWHNCGAILESLLISISQDNNSAINIDYDYQICKLCEDDILILNKEIMFLINTLLNNPYLNIHETMDILYSHSIINTNSLQTFKNTCSFHQDKILFIDKFERGELYPGGPVYHNIPVIILSKEKIDTIVLQNALKKLCQKHNVLNIKMETEGNETYQYVCNTETDYKIIHVDFNENDLIHKCLELSNSSFITGLNNNLYKFYYLNNVNKLDAILFVFNYSIFDDVSKQIIVDDFIEFYNNTDIELSNINFDHTSANQFLLYSKWQKQPNALLQKQATNWKEKINMPLMPLILPMDSPRKEIHLYESEIVKLNLENSLLNKLYKIMQSINTDSYTFFLSLYIIALYRLSCTKEIDIGVIVDNRDKLHLLNNSIGSYTNFALLQNIISDEYSLYDLVKEVERNLSFIKNNSLIPFDKVVMDLNPENDMSRTALFDVLYNYRKLNESASQFEFIDLNLGLGKFDYNLLVKEFNERFEISLTYNKLYYSHNTAQQLLDTIYTICSNIVDGKEKISEIEILNKKELNEIMNTLNHKTNQMSQNTIISELIRVATDLPDNVAIKQENFTITYSELLKRASIVSNNIIKSKSNTNKIIAIYMDKTIDCICNIIGILMSGCAYLPLDKRLPQKRLDFILEDCNPSLIIYDEFSEAFSNYNFINSKNMLHSHHINNAFDHSKSDELAYIIYTSGTTGNPKGVLIKHKNICSLIDNTRSLFTFSSNDIWTMFHSYSFDFSVWELFGCLLTGGKLVLVSSEIAQDTYKFHDLLFNEKVTILNQTPLAFNVLSEIEKSKKNNSLVLKQIIFGGEALNFDRLLEWKERYPNTKLTNMYGITETTIHATYKDISYNDIVNSKGISNIGKPLPGYNILILNEKNKVVPIGVPGEICVSGTGIAAGYLNQPKLTSEKFIKNPYSVDGMIYRSGDLGKLLPNGEIAYLGRIDKQVKIRGFRIELSEIESIISKINGIDNCMVLAKDDDFGSKSLYAYIVAKNEINTNKIKEHLKKFLPSYMLPSYIIKVKDFPMSKNGKIDINLLPTKDFSNEIKSINKLSKTQKELLIIFKKILKQKDLSIYDDFFEHGGQSIKSIQVINEIEKEFDIRITLKEFFSNPTVEKLSLIVEKTYDNIHENKQHYKSELFNKLIPISPLQQSIYYSSIINNSTTYNTPGVICLGKNVKCKKIQKCIQEIINRHESFRTSFIVNNGECFQYIVNDINFELETETIKKAFNVQIDSLMGDFIKTFDLSKAPLLRVKLVIDSNYEYFLMFDSHHIIMDGQSINIFLAELENLYNGTSVTDNLSHYRDYSLKISNSDFYSEKKFWNNKFKEGIEKVSLPCDKLNYNSSDYSGNTITKIICSDLTNSIKGTAIKEKCTDYIIFIVAFYILLYKYTQQNCLTVGSPINCRNNYKYENTIGMFVNVLPFTINIDKNQSAHELIKMAKENWIDIFENSQYPLEYLIKDLNTINDSNISPLFDIIFAFQNNDSHVFKNNWKLLQFHNNISKYLLSVNIELTNNQYSISFEYKTNCFNKENINYMLIHYIEILKELTKDASVKVKNINYINDYEATLINSKFNNTYKQLNENATFVTLFEKQVKKFPNKTAVKCNRTKLSYADLDSNSNKIANFLIDNGLKKGDSVGLFVERNIRTLISIIGILKAGGIYVPIEPNYPDDRIKFIISEASISNFLSSEKTKYNASLIDGILSSDISNKSPNVKITPDDIAYCIFTSGTTGVPKGVLINHKGISNLQSYLSSDIGIFENDNVLQFSNFVFDASIWEISMSFLCGATLIMIQNEKIQNVSMFNKFFQEENITIATLPPNYYLITNNLNPRILFTAGSESSNNVIKKSKGIQYINAYGPTETTVCATCWKMENDFEFNNSLIPIGKPISNTKVYIVDEFLNICGIGVPGELCIAGAGLSQGYLNDEQLTNKKFIKDKFNNEKIYLTGDLAKWLPDGNIVFLGRKDQQIKINGFRIEKEEVRSVINKCSDVLDSYVTCKNINGQNKLVAFYVSPTNLSENDVSEYLVKKLPKFMIPDHIKKIDQLPINISGKVNEKLLPEININNNEFSIPRNETEKKLCSILQNLLNLNNVGIDDNFFNLGGHSVLATKFLYEIESTFDHFIKFEDFFKDPTIRGISNLIKNSSNEEKHYSISYNTNQYHMSDFQKELYAIFENQPESTLYNMPQLYKFDSLIDYEKLLNSLRTIVSKQKIFRTNFKVINDNFYQIISQNNDVDCELINYSDHFEINFNELIKPFNLNNDKLLRVRVLRINNLYDYLFLDIHHIICDGIGMNLFTDLLSNLYNCKNATYSQLQFCDYAENTFNSDYNEDLQYWKGRFNLLPKELELPYDSIKSNEKSETGSFVKWDIDKETFNKISNLSKKFGTSNNVIMLSAVILFLKAVCKTNDIIVGIPVSCRDTAETENIIGPMINTIPFRMMVKSDTISDFINNVKEIYIESLSHKNVPLSKILSAIRTPITNSKHKLFNVIYVQQDNDWNSLNFDDMYTEIIYSEQLQLKADFIINVVSSDKNNTVVFAYNSNKFSKKNIENLKITFKEVLQIMISNNIVSFDDTFSNICSYKSSNEKLLVVKKAFCKVLGIENVSPNDGFFELGGDSIKAIRLVTIIRENGYNVEVADIVKENSVINIANKITNQVNSTKSNNEISGQVPNTPIINEFLSWKLTNPNYYNQSIAFYTELNIEQIEIILSKLTEHHDILRANFNNQLYIKSISDFEKIRIYKYKANNNNLSNIFIEIQNSIDLKNGPLLRGNIIETPKGNILFLCIHHLIIDGFSWRILFDDFNKAKNQLITKHEIHLGYKTDSYIEWANAINEYIANNTNQLTTQYWKWIINKAHLIKGINCLNSNGLCEIINNQFIISHKIVEAYQNFATKFLCNFDDVLLGITKVTLYKIFQIDNIVILLEEYGRYDDISTSDFSKTIGWFTNMYPIITQCSDDIMECILSTKHSKADVPAHGLTYLHESQKYDKIKPDIIFNYMGEVDSEQKNITLLDTGNNSSPLNDINGKISINISMIKNELVINLTSNNYVINNVQLELFKSTFLNISEEIFKNLSVDNQNYSSSLEIDDSNIINGLEF